jgi:hypothetical protein
VTGQMDIPILNALRYVVAEARKQATTDPDGHFVAVGRVANAALLWYEADRLQDFETADRYLQMIPRGVV